MENQFEEHGNVVAVRPSTALAEAEKAKAVQEIQAALVIAKKFPRDEIEAERRILESCKRVGLANQACYAYPRGGEKVSGPSIRLAETIAQHWGNLKFGFREIEQSNGVSSVEAFAWDLETNSQQTRTFSVPHKMMTKKGEKVLSDPRDIYEHVANNAQRRVRAAILGIVPGDVVEKAVKQCRKTIAAGENAKEPLIDRIKSVVAAFVEFGVTRELLEKKLGHSVDAMVPDEIADLREIYNSMKDGMSRREDWFDMGAPTVGGKAAEINEKFKKPEPEKKEKPVDGEFNESSPSRLDLKG